MSFIRELKRRNVIRVGVAYLAGAWLLIQVLETLFPIFGLDERSIQVVVVALAIGFLPALIVAWVFQFTPKGLVRDDGAAQDPGKDRLARFDRAIIVTLLLAVAVFAVHTFIVDPSRDKAEREAAREEGRSEALVESFGDKSIAVLPFANISPDPEQDFFADGISEELLNLLARVEGLRVTSRTSAFNFRGSDVSIPEIAAQLNVKYVLEGSVRRYGDDIRITAQLIDARADMHVWSDTWDRKFEDVFAIQDEVAGKVVDELKIQMSVGIPKAERHDPVAYELYLQARQMSNSYSDDVEALESLLNRVLEIEPGYVDAIVELSFVYWRLADIALAENDIETRDEYWRKEEELLRVAASIEPDNVALNVALAWQNMRDPRQAAHYVQIALGNDPLNERALNAAVVILTRLWRSQEAAPIASHIAERDPLYSAGHWNLARAQFNSGAFDVAEETYLTIAAASDTTGRSAWLAGLAMVLQGKNEEALAHFRDSVSIEELQLHGQVLALHELGRMQESRAALASLLSLEGVGEVRSLPWLQATASAWVGNIDDAFRYLDMQAAIDEGGRFRILADNPLYRNLLDDPRWIPFLRSVELDPEDLAAVEFNPRLPAAIRQPQGP